MKLPKEFIDKRDAKSRKFGLAINDPDESVIFSCITSYDVGYNQGYSDLLDKVRDTFLMCERNLRGKTTREPVYRELISLMRELGLEE